MRILLVDDHEIVRRGLRQLLAEAWPEASFGTAGTVSAAREAMTREPWQLIVLDINLPEGSGLDLLAQARQLSPRVPVLVLSAYPEEEFAVRAFKLGAAGYLTKASVADEMLLAVQRVLAGGKYVSSALADHLAEALGSPRPESPHDTLSPRELEVLCKVATGSTIKEIAAALQLSDSTIATYRSRISEKLGLTSNVDLARYALQHNLVA
ncbi:response regulator transcription factor [Aquabacterium sp.]|uniref:response regulator transcription factor n=1 Tax=Aquabacterium sp. TaxID=1872578 RepID=UPI002C7FFD6B|nr:response regulator transcription factor [Aquabacterium sp.]HSW06909.1 response regulator transcription factor [Aquabacterium sp.]